MWLAKPDCERNSVTTLMARVASASAAGGKREQVGDCANFEAAGEFRGGIDWPAEGKDSNSLSPVRKNSLSPVRKLTLFETASGRSSISLSGGAHEPLQVRALSFG